MKDKPGKEEIIFYIAVFLFNLFLKYVLYGFATDGCHGSGSNPYMRICDANWLYANVFVECVIFLLFLKLSIFSEIRFGYRAVLFALYCVYVISSPVVMVYIWTLPFFKEQIGSEAGMLILHSKTEGGFQ